MQGRILHDDFGDADPGEPEVTLYELIVMRDNLIVMLYLAKEADCSPELLERQTTNVIAAQNEVSDFIRCSLEELYAAS